MQHPSQRFYTHIGLLKITGICRRIARHQERSSYARIQEQQIQKYLQPFQVYFYFYPRKLGEFQMPRYRNSTFASIRITDREEQDFTDWVVAENVPGVEWLNKFAGDGFKVSISWIFDQSSFCVSVIGTDDTKNHRDMVMTSWSDDLEECIRIAAYKHYVMCEGGEWPTSEQGKRWG